MRAATDGWFDAWAPQGGFDPSGLVKGWAVDRAGTLLRLAGIAEFTIWAGTDRLSYRSHAAEAFALSGTAYPRHGVPRVVDPHTGGPAHSRGPAGVAGSELAIRGCPGSPLWTVTTPSSSTANWPPTNATCPSPSRNAAQLRRVGVCQGSVMTSMLIVPL
jgi:hypothetical protein